MQGKVSELDAAIAELTDLKSDAKQTKQVHRLRREIEHLNEDLLAAKTQAKEEKKKVVSEIEVMVEVVAHARKMVAHAE